MIAALAFEYAYKCFQNVPIGTAFFFVLEAGAFLTGSQVPNNTSSELGLRIRVRISQNLELRGRLR